MLGILLSVPLTELMPLLGLPALTAPFVLATWLVLLLGWLESKLFRVAGSIRSVRTPRAARYSSPVDH